LSGAAFSVKDNIEVAGWPLSLGVQADAPVSTRTAVAVQRLLDTGASLVGKTNLPPYGGGIETERRRCWTRSRWPCPRAGTR
jgi:Asp-tRNA(Asn)/Glu-tRNA(Gln) amidotransferase A subunit family amidase